MNVRKDYKEYGDHGTEPYYWNETKGATDSKVKWKKKQEENSVVKRDIDSTTNEQPAEISNIISKLNLP